MPRNPNPVLAVAGLLIFVMALLFDPFNDFLFNNNLFGVPFIFFGLLLVFFGIFLSIGLQDSSVRNVDDLKYFIKTRGPILALPLLVLGFVFVLVVLLSNEEVSEFLFLNDVLGIPLFLFVFFGFIFLIVGSIMLKESHIRSIPDLASVLRQNWRSIARFFGLLVFIVGSIGVLTIFLSNDTISEILFDSYFLYLPLFFWSLLTIIFVLVSAIYFANQPIRTISDVTRATITYLRGTTLLLLVIIGLAVLVIVIGAILSSDWFFDIFFSDDLVGFPLFFLLIYSPILVLLLIGGIRAISHSRVVRNCRRSLVYSYERNVKIFWEQTSCPRCGTIQPKRRKSCEECGGELPTAR